jgi:putative membrane protein
MKTMKNTGTIVLVVSILFLAGLFLYREFGPAGGYDYGYGGWGGHMMGGMGFGMGSLMMVFWGLILFGLILIINWLLNVNRSAKDDSGENALEILKRRYANGEIDRGQYEQMRRELSL